jgi:hypothetical protein
LIKPVVGPSLQQEEEKLADSGGMLAEKLWLRKA